MVKSSSTSFVTAGLLLGIFMAAIDNTIVATAMGTIVGDLGNYEQFVWVTAAYMVAMMLVCQSMVNYLTCMVGNDFSYLDWSFFYLAPCFAAWRIQ